jgi:hypothetical protein
MNTAQHVRRRNEGEPAVAAAKARRAGAFRGAAVSWFSRCLIGSPLLTVGITAQAAIRLVTEVFPPPPLDAICLLRSSR